MTPEAAESIRIADEFLPDSSPERRRTLALEILNAIMRHADNIIATAISNAFERGNMKEHQMNHEHDPDENEGRKLCRIVGHTELCLFLLPFLQQGDFTVEALVSALLADFQVIDRATL